MQERSQHGRCINPYNSLNAMKNTLFGGMHLVQWHEGIGKIGFSARIILGNGNLVLSRIARKSRRKYLRLTLMTCISDLELEKGQPSEVSG
jgi:hypothetical protein